MKITKRKTWRSWLGCSCLLLLLMCLPGGSTLPLSAAAEDDAARRETEFQSQVLPIVKQYCYKCHGNSKPEGDLVLTSYTKSSQLLAQTSVWRKVAQRVKDVEMPPKEAPKPTSEERARLTQWIETNVKAVDCSHPIPGRTTIRRLTRVEYRNTIRDLLGVDYSPATDFPADDVGYGFDNIADVLTLSSLHLEKYLAAAESISRQAVADSARGNYAFDRAFPAGDLIAKGGLAKKENKTWHTLLTEGELATDVSIPATGEYLIRIRAFGDQAQNEPVKIAFRVDGNDVQKTDVKAERPNWQTYDCRTKLEKGARRIAIAFLNDFWDDKATDPKKRDRNFTLVNLEVKGPTDAPQSGESTARLLSVTPSEQLPPNEAARSILRRVGGRAFRRPLSDEELNRLVKFFEASQKSGDKFEEGVRLALEAILVSPHFLYRIERDPAAGESERTIDDFELATRMSYFLWSSMPDDELFRLAADKKLRAGGTLAEQVRRMLRDPKAAALTRNFAAQWLQLRLLDKVAPDKGLFPQFDDALRADMRTETEMLFDYVVSEDRPVTELLSADYTFVNERLAGFYGFPNVSGRPFRKVSTAGTPRGGLLTQASILTVTSNPSRTSPVKRGRWILENLLADPPPPPSPDAGQLPDDKPGELVGTLRQRTEQHRKDPRCAPCHVRMDPLGFALENFSAIGAWRDRDGKEPVDSSGELPGGHKFKGINELRTILLKERSADFVRCASEKLLTFGLGRGLEYYDRCAIDKIIAGAAKQDYRFSQLVIEVVQSDPFQKRAARQP